MAFALFLLLGCNCRAEALTGGDETSELHTRTARTTVRKGCGEHTTSMSVNSCEGYQTLGHRINACRMVWFYKIRHCKTGLSKVSKTGNWRKEAFHHHSSPQL